ncbi:Uncharacterised protein [Raoultella ornithinolytica]|nr:Uncharacterised protein [Raoultella ornithinolytica]
MKADWQEDVLSAWPGVSGPGMIKLQNISDGFCQLVFKNRLGFREFQIHFIGVRDNTCLVFMLITGFSAGLHFSPGGPLCNTATLSVCTCVFRAL